ncbi:DMT family transporter [Sphingomicrobium aestuariivivum]|uniref:DMT family transporter n=1 Tax=Sphingomicrobium aestuariivivum TaxID=1582356 RepID=UPI001FD6A16A|nr:DMT family transporter [Sphingomicrobium aestuariivivum]MCJ8191202.1 DMT family transporter [Sphingomicrobium aestuariivivum]
MERTVTPLPLIALLVGASALAVGPWFVRLADVGPIASGFWRLALGSVMLFALAGAMHERLRLPPRHLTILLVAAAFFFAADLAAWHEGILLTKMGNSVLFGNFGSFAFACYGLWLARTWPRPAQVGALLLAATGTLLLLSGSLDLGPETFWGDILCLTAGLLYAGYLIAVDKARPSLSPLPLLAWVSLFGALMLLPVAASTPEALVPTNWGPVLVLALSSQVIGQGLLVYAIGRLPPLVVGLGLLTQPAVAGLVGWLVYGEVFTLKDWAGAVMIGAALVLVRLRPRTARAT